MNNKELIIHLGPCFACKKPSLWIEENACITKLATFSNKETALKFADYLEYIGLNVSEEKTEDDND